MSRKKKQELDVLVALDNREKITTYSKDLLDDKVGKDGIRIYAVISETVKPLDVNTGKPCAKSTGDLQIYTRRANTDDEWKLSNLCIELKKGLDIVQSMANKTHRSRLEDEAIRAKEYGLDFYFISTNSMHDTISEVSKVKILANMNSDIAHFDHFADYNKFLAELGHNPIIVSGKSLAWTIRRTIKRHIKMNKLQYM